MPRTALSDSEVEAFRDTLCSAATRRFAEQGYEGVTLRGLARDLGCSPMTPYRYFENKAEIFEAVRSAAFARFAQALQDALYASPSPAESLPALCRAYVSFAVAEPHAYRIMFELDQSKRMPTPPETDLRSWLLMRTAVEHAVSLGILEGDPEVLAHLFWSSVHGLVALHLSGMLVLGRTPEELVEAFIERELSQVDTRA
ncbi:MAG: TetR/AcrR family transcriptional regulator [Myxococcota bacterium]|jgi:AcrR family transcriptional regulator|nr:TetR/AcrR family transcriptional regulator [Myxococcota bacterium]